MSMQDPCQNYWAVNLKSQGVKLTPWSRSEIRDTIDIMASFVDIEDTVTQELQKPVNEEVSQCLVGQQYLPQNQKGFEDTCRHSRSEAGKIKRYRRE